MPLLTRLHTPPPPCHPAPITGPPKASSLNHSKIFLLSSSKPISSYVRLSISRGVTFSSNPTDNEADEEMSDSAKLKKKVEALGVNTDSCTPGLYDHLICPKCKGGRTMERSLSFHTSQNWNYAMWRCFRLECGWAGKVFADNRKAYPSVNGRGKSNSFRQLTEESLRLEALGDELLAYFAERMISMETLQKNYVMQVAGNKKIIAFTYRCKGLLVGCKYRTIDKKYWQFSYHQYQRRLQEDDLNFLFLVMSNWTRVGIFGITIPITMGFYGMQDFTLYLPRLIISMGKGFCLDT